MFQASQLNEQQVQAIHQWAAAGDQINDIQKKIQQEWGLQITYMETRFLVLDLAVNIISPQPDKPEQQNPVKEVIATGEVSVKVDTIVRAGMMVSGSVQFSDGHTADWGVDNMGSLDLNPEQAGYSPSQEDLMEFQQKLQEALKNM